MKHGVCDFRNSQCADQVTPHSQYMLPGSLSRARPQRTYLATSLTMRPATPSPDRTGPYAEMLGALAFGPNGPSSTISPHARYMMPSIGDVIPTDSTSALSLRPLILVHPDSVSKACSRLNPNTHARSFQYPPP